MVKYYQGKQQKRIQAFDPLEELPSFDAPKEGCGIVTDHVYQKQVHNDALAFLQELESSSLQFPQADVPVGTVAGLLSVFKEELQ